MAESCLKFENHSFHNIEILKVPFANVSIDIVDHKSHLNRYAVVVVVVVV